MPPITSPITLPYNWTPRWYQMEVFEALRQGKKRAVLLWSRRLGKDDFALHYTACAAMQRVGNYWHMLPQANQCRRAIWDAVNESTGKRRIDEAFPLEMRETTRSQDMFIKFKNGSTWQLVGSDSFDALVGSPPVGLVFSEYALADPRAWAMLRPIVAGNGGYAMMISTPRGRNHFHKLYEMAKADPENWFTSKVTAPESGVFPPERLEQEKRELIGEYGEEEGLSLYNREYMCSFDSAVSGSYYGSIMDSLEESDPPQITSVPHDPILPVITAWDLGISNAMVTWCYQHVGAEIRVIDCIVSTGSSLADHVRELKNRPYNYEQHILPHDVKVRELGSGKSRYEMLRSLGVNPITIARNLPVDDGINAVKVTLPRMWFDQRKCAVGIDALKGYRRKYDELRKCYSNHPEHDWTSDYADAMRMYCVGYSKPAKLKTVTSIMESRSFRGVW